MVFNIIPMLFKAICKKLSGAKKDADKNFSEEKPPEEATQPCPLGDCAVKSMVVKCGHAERSYSLKLPQNEKDKADNPNKELQVIAGNSKTPDKISVTVKPKKTLCKEHKPKSVLVSSLPKKISYKTNAVDFEALSKKPNSWFKYVWLPAIAPYEYTVKPNSCYGCSSDLDALVKVYPDINWNVSVKLGLGGISESYTSTSSKSEYTSTEDSWSLQGNASLQYNGKEHKLEADFKQYIETTLEFMNVIKDCSDTVLPKINEMGNAKLEITWPALELSLSGYFEELSDKHLVDTAYALSFKASPLMGVKGTVDILDWLLKAGGPIGLTLSKIKAIAAEGIGKEGVLYAKAVIAIDMSVEAQIETSIEAKKNLRETNPTVSGEVVGEIPFTLEGKAHAEGDAFWVHFNIGVICGGTFSVGTKLKAYHDEIGVFLQGEFFFTGLIFYYAVYASGGVSTKKPKAKHLKTTDNKDGKGGYSQGEKYELIPPGKWPSDEDSKLYLIRNK